MSYRSLKGQQHPQHEPDGLDREPEHDPRHPRRSTRLRAYRRCPAANSRRAVQRNGRIAAAAVTKPLFSADEIYRCLAVASYRRG